MLHKVKVLIGKTLYVSKLTTVSNKKLRILFSVIFANIAVALDVVIILIFSVLLTNDINYSNEFIVSSINFILENKYLLIVIVILRFVSLLVERLNLELLGLAVNENLRLYLMRQSFEKGNLSTSDSYYYINQVATHVSGFYRAITQFINNGVQIIGFSVFLLVSDFRIFSFFGVGAFLLIFPTKYLISRGKYYQHISFEDNHKVFSNIQRIIENTFLIKILNTATFEFDRFKNKLSRFTESQSKNLVYGSINSVLPTFSTVLILAILLSLTNFVKNISFEFIGVLLRLFQSLSVFNNSLNLVLNSSVHVDELYKLDKFSPHQFTENHVYDNQSNYAVEFKNVNFKYFNSEESIFENVNFGIEKNKHTIVTGANGSGKSTLLGLITGLYLPEIGEIVISSKKIGYIGVTPLIFEGTLKENILYGNNINIEEHEIYKLINQFNLYPDETDIDLTKLVSNTTLSSGQMQKISFIRALLNNSEILLLDEATSNLDTSSKQIVFEILKEKNITIINSTHSKEDFDYDFELNIKVADDIRNILIR